MASVEDKIVSMKFDNKQFEPNAQKTMSTLDRLKAALNFGGAGKGLTDLQNTANRFSLSGLGNAASGVAGKFSAMSVAAIAAIANLTAKAVDAGLKIANALTLAPVKQGFQEYETQLNAVQTILSNTRESGAGLKDVNATLSELNAYSDQTIYNFSEMAKNIGTFTAAGVDLKTSAMSIKGIANLAALSGSNSQQASTAMYQLSQAISSGRVSLQDWNSVVNAGMGGTVFQRALAQNAERMGTLSDGAVKLTGKMKNVSIEGKSFRESITAKPGEKSWLTSKVLTETLKQFTGDLSIAQLKAMGFSDAMAKSVYEQGLAAKNAATEVKTFTQLTGTLQEAAASGWAQTFQILIGDFTEAKALWTDVNNVVGGFIGDSAKARNEMLQTWKDLGGRRALLNSFRNIFAGLVSIITPIKEAFRQIFPATTGKQLYQLTVAFMNFTKNLKIGADTAGLIKRSFAGLFAIFSIGWSILKGLLGLLGDLFGIVADGSGGFLQTTASVGDFLVALDQTIKKGDLVNKFFAKVGSIIKSVVGAVKSFATAFLSIFAGINIGELGSLGDVFGRIGDRLAPLVGTGGAVARVFEWLFGIAGKLGGVLEPLGAAIGTALGGIGDAIGKAFEAGDFNSVYDALNTGLLAGIILLIKKFMDKGLNIDFGGGLLSGIKDTFGALTGSLTAMQNQIQAKTLMSIAIAVAALTVSIVALSMIDSGKLTKALTAMGVAFGQLMVAMTILTKISGAAGFAKVPIIAGALILLSTAVLILTAAVRNLSGLNWEELSKGLLGVGALLAMLVGVSLGLQKSSGSMLRAGIAMIPLAIGLKILASAVKDFAGMSWGEIGKGLVTVAAALIILGAGMALIPPNMIGTAAALVIVGLALKIIASALTDMGGMNWGEIAKSMVVLAGALLILAGGLYLMTAALPGAAALVVVALALAVLAPVLLLMATMSWEDIGKGMVVLAGSLLILAGGLYLMTAAAAGAAALVIVAAALAVLAPVLILLGTMSWQAIATGLGALAGAFLVIGLAGLMLAPIIPAILGLAAALLLLGLSTALIGVGLLAIATAFSVFVAAATAGIAVVVGMINLIPQFMRKFAEGIGAFATTIAAQAGKFTRAFVSLLNSLLDAVIQVAPKIGRAFNVLMDTALRVVVANSPKIVNAGMKLIIDFLNAISKNVPKITRIGVDIIVKFMTAIQSQQGRLLNAGAKLIISFINNLASTIRGRSGEMRAAGHNLAGAIISGMTGGIWDGIRSVTSAAAGVARRALAAAKSALGINSPSKEFYKLGVWSDEGFADGLSAATNLVTNAAGDVGTDALNAVKDSVRGISDAISAEMELNPTITPVLDLGAITRDAEKIGDALKRQGASGDLSYRKAANILNTKALQEDGYAGANASGGDTVLEFVQHNHSPRALSSIEIYRNTRNQLSMAKEALRVS